MMTSQKNDIIRKLCALADKFPEWFLTEFCFQLLQHQMPDDFAATPAGAKLARDWLRGWFAADERQYENLCSMYQTFRAKYLEALVM